jgi:hypothetical protein
MTQHKARADAQAFRHSAARMYSRGGNTAATRRLEARMNRAAVSGGAGRLGTFTAL